MTISEAKTLLESAPCDDKPSRINPSITRRQAVEIVRRGLDSNRALISDGMTLDPMYEKRVYQVCRDQKRPRY